MSDSDPNYLPLDILQRAYQSANAQSRPRVYITPDDPNAPPGQIGNPMGEVYPPNSPGLNPFPPLASLGAGMVPGAGIADVMGKLPNFRGGTSPSFGQNIQQGQYGQAALQGLGAVGDVAMAIPGIGPPLGEILKGVSTAGRTAKEAKAAATAEEAAGKAYAATKNLSPAEAQAMVEKNYGDIGTHPHEDALTVNSILHPDTEPLEPRSNNVGEIAQALQDRSREALRQTGVVPGGIVDHRDPHPIHDEIVSRAMASEIQAAMQRGEAGAKTAQDWYTTKVQEAMGHAATIWPEIATDPNAKMAFTAALAITSNGENVRSNVRLAEKVYEQYRKTGKFPTNVVANEQIAMNGSFKRLNEMIAEGGVDKTREFLDSKSSVRDLENAGHTISGENKDTMVHGSAIFGPKIGAGFYQNLNGNYDPVTMDQWFMRSINRLKGNLVGNPDAMPKAIARVQNALRAEGKSVPRDPDKFESLVNDIVAKHEKDFRVNRADYDSGKKVKSELTKAAERYQVNLSGVRDQPKSGGERNWLRDRVNRANEILKTKGINLTNADLQAVWWYPEKELYSKLGGVDSEAINTDYATVLKELAARRAAGQP